jgi:hypothetical protein
MKKKNGSFYKLIISLEILKYAIFLIIAYIVIWGLIIEPHLPQHYYGVTDLKELIEAVLLLIAIRWINSFIGFFHAVEFFNSGRNQKFISALKCIKRFGKNFKFDQIIILNESFVGTVENKKYIYMVTGFITGLKLSKAYCFGWAFNENGNDIDLYQFVYTKDKPIYHKFRTVPAGSECVFNMEYRERIMIKWKLYIKEGRELNLIYNDDLMTPKRFHWGIYLNNFANNVLQDEKKGIQAVNGKILLNDDLLL